MVRIGHGFDVHAFEPGEFLMLGGVRVPYERAFRAHSDGDVLLHALTDALLGAAAMGDIGQHFPDTDPLWKDADSRDLLRRCVAMLNDKELRCTSADMTIVAQAPKLASYLPQMCEYVSLDLGLERNRVNVKATTSEHLGFCGRKEGIAAYAVVLLSEQA